MMSDVQKLRDVIEEYRKENKELDKNLKKAEERMLQNRKAETAK